MKVLIIGFGSIAKKHYHALVRIKPSVEVIALRHSPEAVPLDSIISVYNLEEMRLQGPYDFVIISNPTYKHRESINIVLELNCPLFIEKPLFNDIGPRDIFEKIRVHKTMTYVACNLRFIECLEYLKTNLLPSLVINEVNIYCGSFLPEWRVGVDYRENYSAHASQGGGVHLDLIHELDYTYWLFGKPTNVDAHRRSCSTLQISAVDYANYLLEYEHFAVNIILNYYRKDKKRTIELVCTDDTYTVDLLDNTIFSACKQEKIFKSKQSFLDTYQKQLEYFISKLPTATTQDAEPIMNNIEEAFEVLNICLR